MLEDPTSIGGASLDGPLAFGGVEEAARLIVGRLVSHGHCSQYCAELVISLGAQPLCIGEEFNHSGVRRSLTHVRDGLLRLQGCLLGLSPRT